jgi:hypothetical protein
MTATALIAIARATAVQVALLWMSTAKTGATAIAKSATRGFAKTAAKA